MHNLCLLSAYEAEHYLLLNFSDLAISAPPNLPPHTILIPFAPNLIADCPDFFMAFLNATRFSNCLAIESATNDASVSGFLISLISSDIFLSDNFDKAIS